MSFFDKIEDVTIVDEVTESLKVGTFFWDTV